MQGHLFRELRTKGKNSIFERYFCEYFDVFRVGHYFRMFYYTLNAGIEILGSQQYSYGYDPLGVSGGSKFNFSSFKSFKTSSDAKNNTSDFSANFILDVFSWHDLLIIYWSGFWKDNADKHIFQLFFHAALHNGHQGVVFYKKLFHTLSICTSDSKSAYHSE